MKIYKISEKYKLNNVEGDLISEEDVLKCIRAKGSVYSDIVEDLPENTEDMPLNPIDIDSDGNVTIEHGGDYYNVSLDNIKRVEY